MLTSAHQSSYALMMRTTLTLDADVAAELGRLRKTHRGKFRALVNQALRAGLDQMSAPSQPREPFRIEPFSLGKCHLPSLDNIHDVLVFGEGEDYK